jgi:AraC-like DNA-binding protein
MPVNIQLPERQEYFGILLQPLAIKKIFKTPGCEFSNTIVDLTLLDSGFNNLWQQLADQSDFTRRVSVFLNWIGKYSFDATPQEKLINQFLYAINQHDLSVTELAASLCYSPRQLGRKLLDATGMNTEETLLYKKYLHAVDLIHYSDQSLTEIAYQSHFSDQSHLIKSFKAYANMTPGEYRRNKGPVRGHIYGNVR